MLRIFLLLTLLPTGCVIGDELDDEDPDAELVPPAPPVQPPSATGFTFGAHLRERRESVPITKKGDWKVIYSVPVPALSGGEYLAVSGEVTLSMCAPSEGKPCKRDTPFSPHFSAKIILADGMNDTNGQRLSSVPEETCSRREHHCTLVIREEVASGLSGDKFVNLVVEADGDGNSKDLMKVEKKHGGVYVTRMGANADRGGRSIPADAVETQSMKIDNVDTNNGGSRRDPHVLFRARLDNPQPGDILDVAATINAVVNDGSCDPLIMHQVFVSTNNNSDPETTAILELTAQNGTNCVGSNCTFKKSGAGQLPGNLPSTLFVAVVAKAGRSCVQSGDSWRVGGGSGMQLRLRRSQ